MAREIVFDDQQIPQETGLARIDQVDFESLRKKYMENVEDGMFQREGKDPLAVQAELEQDELLGFWEFFDIEETFTENAAEELVEKIKQDNEELLVEAKDKIVELDEHLKNISSDFDTVTEEKLEDAKGSLEMLSQALYDETTITIAEETKKKEEEEKNKAIDEVFAQAKAESNNVNKSNNSNYNRSNQNITNGSGYNNGYGYGNGYRNGYNNTKAHEPQTREQQIQQMYENSASTMRALAKKASEVREKDSKNRYVRKRKGIKGLWDRTKSWFKSKDAALVMKVGLFITMETALAVLSGRFSFDGGGQVLAYIGMMLGVFYIGRELAGEGLEPTSLFGPTIQKG